jgi:hypothetical protein
MRIVMLLLIITALQGPAPTPSKVGKPEQQQASPCQQASCTDLRGTAQSPLIVKGLPAEKTKQETADAAADRDNKAANDRHVIYMTGALTLISFLQLLVYGYQAKKLRETVESAKEQSKAMERHIGEASRSAKAMEDVVSVINFGNQAALRAYLTVIIGSAVHQEKRGEGLDDLRFEAKPIVVNTGNTPARNVSLRKSAAILPIPILEDFKFPLPEEETPDVGWVGAHQSSGMDEIVQDFVPWENVADVKKGTSEALCVWGIITYEDIFGGKHYTKFGQILTWRLDGNVYGHYIAGQNDGN